MAGCIAVASTAGQLSAQTIVAAAPHSTVTSGFVVTEGYISDGPYVELASVSAKAGKLTWVSKNPDYSDIDAKLRVKALKMGADAVIRVRYISTGASMRSWDGLKAEGLAIKYLSAKH